MVVSLEFADNAIIGYPLDGTANLSRW